MKHNVFIKHQWHFQNYPVLYHIVRYFLYLFFLLSIYSEAQIVGVRKMM